MLIQILSHTPLYVWAILAFLVWRGVAELREREIAISRMFVLPLVMLVLSLHDIALKFGFDATVLAAWMTAFAAAALLSWRFGRVRVAPGSAPGRVRVAGSVVPLLLMLSIFALKYVTSVLLAVRPDLADQGMVVMAVCAMFGVFNGYFLGRLLRDVGLTPAARFNRRAAGS